MNFKPSLGLYFIVLLVGASIGFVAGKNQHETICTSASFRYINQQLACGPAYVIDKRSYIQLKNKLEKVISEKTEAGEVTHVSIYFRDLQYGPTLGIWEHDKFSPASLLKLPLLLAYLSFSEGKPEFLERRITTPSFEDEFEQAIPPKYSIKANRPYSLNELLAYMIKYSDNASYFVLLEHLRGISPQRDLLSETFAGLGIIDPLTPLEDTISVKSYASIFVQLYHASFLQNKELSEKALTQLTDTDFVQGIVSGVPASIEVAHKFGERSAKSEESLIQLHDCGIVYYPGNPYLVCIMTKGKDLQKLADVIALISKMVYEEFDSRKL